MNKDNKMETKGATFGQPKDITGDLAALSQQQLKESQICQTVLITTEANGQVWIMQNALLNMEREHCWITAKRCLINISRRKTVEKKVDRIKINLRDCTDIFPYSVSLVLFRQQHYLTKHYHTRTRL